MGGYCTRSRPESKFRIGFCGYRDIAAIVSMPRLNRPAVRRILLGAGAPYCCIQSPDHFTVALVQRTVGHPRVSRSVLGVRRDVQSVQ